MRHFLNLRLLLVAIPLLFFGCDGLIGGAGEQSLLDRLETGRDFWQEQDIDTYNYTYVRGTLEQEGPETEVFVVNNQVDSVVVGNAPADIDAGLTVEEVFDLVEDAIRADTDQFEMGFNDVFGFTDYYAVVYRRSDRSNSDYFEVFDFHSDQVEVDETGDGDDNG